MIFLACILTFATATALIPVILQFAGKYMPIIERNGNPLLPALAAILFLVSFYVPDIRIFSETSTFQQHFIGGGMYSALLYVYFKQVLGVKNLSWWIDTLALFLWISSLGITNELLELTLIKTDILHIDMSDSHWNLLANTLGAFSMYGMLVAAKRVVNPENKK